MRFLFQYASNLRYSKSARPLLPTADTLILAGGTGSLKRESTFHLYNWVGREFDFVYTLLDEPDEYEGVLPANVHALNHGVHRFGTSGALITGNRLSNARVDIAVFSGYPRHQQVPYAPVNVFQRGVEAAVKNRVVCLANDAKHPFFDPARVAHLM
jgi:hypothetical protein